MAQRSEIINAMNRMYGAFADYLTSTEFLRRASEGRPYTFNYCKGKEGIYAEFLDTIPEILKKLISVDLNYGEELIQELLNTYQIRFNDCVDYAQYLTEDEPKGRNCGESVACKMIIEYLKEIIDLFYQKL